MSRSGGGRFERDHAAATFCLTDLRDWRRRDVIQTLMIPVSWSTYDFSVSIRSDNGLSFFGFELEGELLIGVVGVIGVAGRRRP